ncbi:sugar phosphate isomerase/epimerase [Catalinimonas alkaloidigena]|uniref:sugar phosphate isomerase/epimerase family protein n=1 Tax=Catalinimonas alkaloidigena TaxID=1075417 RepID=UPI002406D120|nr:TIM barrel protein [Catalinimonas alkaloidigena]MDF9798742.1 sugar phosphate isomerase/epimerase [Catalinimonas alkaloidigena]
MNIQFFCPRWGSESLPYEAFFENVKTAGYDGVEMSLPLDEDERDEIAGLMQQYKLEFIAQHWECILSPTETYEADYDKYLRNLAAVKPLFINSQSGKDYFSQEHNVQILKLADKIAEETGVEIVHETHRGKFSYAIDTMPYYLKTLPGLRLCADFSHWCVVSESLLEAPEQEAMLKEVYPRVDHIHARIGFQQAPQVSEPKAPEFQETLHRHLVWWDEIIKLKKEQGAKVLTVTPEFGPAPYMPQLPFVKEPLTNQWEANLYMMGLLRERYQA